MTTLEGLDPEVRRRWADAFVARGASQCGFCTPGIIMRLTALEAAGGATPPSRLDVESALRAHLCRCTGWQPIVDAACSVLGSADPPPPFVGGEGVRDPLLAAWRSEVEGSAMQRSGTDVVLGDGGFADDGAPSDALVQLGADGPLDPGLRAARARVGRIQGRNSTVPLSHPVDLPEGDWALTLRTTWVEPAYVEPDASWCRPGGLPADPLGNGGAFGGKRHSSVSGRASDLAEDSGRVVRVLWRREDVVRSGPKRPPLALALRADGTGVVRLGRSPGSADLEPAVARVRALCPGVEVEQVDVAGPPVAPDLRGAAWAEVLAAQTVVAAPVCPAGVGCAQVAVPGGGRAVVEVRTGEGGRGRVDVEVWAGEVLCEVTLRSYVVGAVHQALGLVWSEGIAVDDGGRPVDLTVRSFGILAARDLPDVTVSVHPGEGWPVCGSDAVFVAALAAAWMAEGRLAQWPTRRSAPRSPRLDVAPSDPREEAT